MAVDMFLKIGTPAVTGESLDSVHSTEMDVLAWSWGVSNSGDAQRGGGAGAGKAHVGDISVTKYVDAASTALFLACCNGQHYTNATLTIRKAGTNPLEYLVITMGEVMITSYSTGGSGGQDRLTENVTLNFANVTYNYTPQTATGAAGATATTTWDMTKNGVIS